MSDKEKRPLAVPKWWKNTYFLFGFALAIIGILGFIRGADYIRDPGQPDNANLAWWYLFAAFLFIVNGFVSHQATVAEYRRETE